MKANTWTLLFLILQLLILQNGIFAAETDLESGLTKHHRQRDISGRYHPEGEGHHHAHGHDHSHAHEHVPEDDPESETQFPYGNEVIPVCGCVLRGQCGGREEDLVTEDILRTTPTTLVCGQKFQQCCKKDVYKNGQPWPGVKDLYTHLAPCVAEETCRRPYGTQATDVRDYGTIPNCPGHGSVRCLDGFLVKDDASLVVPDTNGFVIQGGGVQTTSVAQPAEAVVEAPIQDTDDASLVVPDTDGFVIEGGGGVQTTSVFEPQEEVPVVDTPAVIPPQQPEVVDQQPQPEVPFREEDEGGVQPFEQIPPSIDTSVRQPICITEHQCRRKYGVSPTDVRDYGTFANCEQFGYVRCLDDFSTGINFPDEPIHIVVPIIEKVDPQPGLDEFEIPRTSYGVPQVPTSYLPPRPVPTPAPPGYWYPSPPTTPPPPTPPPTSYHPPSTLPPPPPPPPPTSYHPPSTLPPPPPVSYHPPNPPTPPTSYHPPSTGYNPPFAVEEQPEIEEDEPIVPVEVPRPRPRPIYGYQQPYYFPHRYSYGYGLPYYGGGLGFHKSFSFNKGFLLG